VTALSPRPVVFLNLTYPAMDVKFAMVQGMSHGSAQLPRRHRWPLEALFYGTKRQSNALQ
jgi:hypothetical protein